ncbi:MAG: mandelate racemase/muconate lactonizing enzyme family protein [Alphaproteobacteria bacterium]|jgi:D-galactarolactone cycloisomerase|nr:mandelate racemase [Rhodospirillaceae bacterium]MDP6406184.1 mandelate racemase/muconate lactonizing enzyme family protein [Alphaproteobacteria bacterium]HJP22639.1 mandelate racemase/muconate lactonizing enzyme family protein [Alphaproteobacteria bacterium]|tara:strand:+ start:277 stop:1407 length:1131 start_codon:yes stop_codon:yes gene_type:complete
MKITEVIVHVLEAALSEPFHWSINRADVRASAVVEVVTESGLSGFGECLGPARPCAAMVEAYAPLLLGNDALASELIWQTLYDRFRDQGQKGVPIAALSGVDIALWDLKGKHFGAPVHQLMGGPLRTEVEAYATGTYRKDQGDPFDYIIDEVKGYVTEGFGGVKLKIGFEVSEDAALIRAVRQAIGPDVKLMLDANHGYDVIEAIRLGRQVEDCDITWFEEPVVPEDLAGYSEIKRAIAIPLAGGECEYTRFGFRQVLASRAIDILQPDTCAAGGLSECKKIADMAWAHGVRYVPHVWGTAIGLATALQLLAVLPHNPPGNRPLEPVLEFDRSEHPARQAVVREPIEHVGGRVQVPEGPGLGIEIDRAGLESFKVN